MKQVSRHVLCVLVAMSACGVVGCDGGGGGSICVSYESRGSEGLVDLTIVQGTRPGSGQWSVSHAQARDAKGHALGCMIESFDDSMNGSGITLSLPCTRAVDSIRLDATLLHEGKARRVEAGWKADGPSRLGWQRAYCRIDGKETRG